MSAGHVFYQVASSAGSFQSRSINRALYAPISPRLELLARQGQGTERLAFAIPASASEVEGRAAFLVAFVGHDPDVGSERLAIILAHRRDTCLLFEASDGSEIGDSIVAHVVERKNIEIPIHVVW